MPTTTFNIAAATANATNMSVKIGFFIVKLVLYY